MAAYGDIQSLLNEAKEPGLSGKGASDEVIRWAESQLGIGFPESYRLFLREHGWGHFGSLGLIVGLGSDIPNEWQAGVDVVRVTIQEREGPLSLPDFMLPFHTNGAGDWYAMDCSRHRDGQAPVVLICHEKAALGEPARKDVSEDFSSWVYQRLRRS